MSSRTSKRRRSDSDSLSSSPKRRITSPPQDIEWNAPLAARILYLRDGLKLPFDAIAEVISELRATDIMQALEAGEAYSTQGRLRHIDRSVIQHTYAELQVYMHGTCWAAINDLNESRHDRAMARRIDELERTTTTDQPAIARDLKQFKADYQELQDQRSAKETQRIQNRCLLNIPCYSDLDELARQTKKCPRHQKIHQELIESRGRRRY
ncbi:MAG: hypothetical protein L6R40_002923 [Gallowayella cf. fulva]|nr:MAG: hypothetical protein L6R40_002923 [Xanthomendoza cf. fulva]